jgi:hypothetical protein
MCQEQQKSGPFCTGPQGFVIFVWRVVRCRIALATACARP